MDHDEHGTAESTRGLTAEKIGENDAIFRDANQAIREVAAEQRLTDPIPFICECADPGCRELVRLAPREYEDVRSDPRRFLNAPGHDAAGQGWAQVVERRDGYVIVEKVGAAAEVAEELADTSDSAVAGEG